MLPQSRSIGRGSLVVGFGGRGRFAQRIGSTSAGLEGRSRVGDAIRDGTRDEVHSSCGRGGGR